MNQNDEYNSANDTCIVKIEGTMSTVSATSTTTTTTNPGQNIILILDYSQSMKNNGGYTALRPAAENFITTVLKNPDNKLAIIKYQTYLYDDHPTFTNDVNTAKGKLSANVGGATNIDMALTRAYNLILENNLDASKTSVVLMTDGIPTHYYKNPENNPRSIPSYTSGWVASGASSGFSAANVLSVNQAIESAGWIKETGAALYTVGFGFNQIGGRSYDDKSVLEHAKETIRAIATQSTDPSEKYCYDDTTDVTTLTSAFSAIAESITENEESNPVNTDTTVDGIATIKEGFAKNDNGTYVTTQNVELYTDYKTSTQARVLTGNEDESGILSMSDFFTTGYATYNSDSTISFNLGKFMKDKGISKDKKVTIKFINIVQINRNSASRRISSANIFSMFSSNLEVDDIDENKVNEFAQKANEVEKSKKEEVVVTENNKEAVETNATTDNETEVEVVTDNKEENTNVSEENTEKTEESKEVEEKTENEIETEIKSETTTEVNESEIDN